MIDSDQPAATLTWWQADFLDRSNMPDLDRRKWPKRRDLYVRLQAYDWDDANRKVFKIAHVFLRNPFRGKLYQERG